jgi:hypothetical protein
VMVFNNNPLLTVSSAPNGSVTGQAIPIPFGASVPIPEPASLTLRGCSRPLSAHTPGEPARPPPMIGSPGKIMRPAASSSRPPLAQAHHRLT